MKDPKTSDQRVQRIVRRVAFAAVMLAVPLVSSSRAQAAPATMTQLEYIKFLVQMSGETDKFTETSTPGDYINWARTRGMKPNREWQAQASIERDTVAETMVQFLKLDAGKSTDYYRILQVHGIQVPAKEQLTKSDFAKHLGTLPPQAKPPPWARPNSPQKPDRDRDKDKDKDKDRDKNK